MTLRHFIAREFFAFPLYFVMNLRSVIAHARAQHRLHLELNDPVRNAAISRYVDALRAAGDV